MPNPTKIPVSRSDKPEETAQRETQQATAELKSLFKRPITPVPQAELDRLAKVALGDTGQGVQNLMTCPLVCLFNIRTVRRIGINSPRSVKTNRQPSKLATIAFAVSLLSAAHAAQFSVHLVDSTGPTIDGIVDTATDVFRITSWVDSSLTPRHRVPALSQLPLSLHAFTAAGSLYDVPDSWNGQVGTDPGFAFFLPIGQDLTTVQWIQGQPDSSWHGASFGWGGLRNNLGGVVFRNPFGFSYLPNVDSTTAVSDISFEQITVTPLPEPASIAIRVSHVDLSQVELCWQTATNTWYQLQYRSTLSPNHWLPLSTNWVTGDGTRFCTTDAVLHESPQKFYQLSVTNSPPR